ncbi:MAG TPA: putative RNA uridine N3 methyltransferase [Nitrososphaerales archaeon]|nr:putative RNA uridine N3 methyltransferase [Nitrososphaerales archaeon]
MISIAIPDSMFVADDTLRDKTIKVGEIARSAAIFGVERIYIYRDASRNYDSNYEIARLIFEYADTPQYLRKRLIGKRKELDFVGLLPPLRTPNHQRDAIPKLSEFRDGVVFSQNGELVVDLGAREFAKLEGRGQEGQRLTFQVTSLTPLTAKMTQRPDGIYWGYEVRRAPSLSRFLRSANFDTTIFTSRLGQPINERWKQFCDNCKGSKKILLCFGSPDSGVDKFLKQDGTKISDFEAMYLNTFPSQNTETVRLEEAIIGTLAIVNLVVKLDGESQNSQK